MAIADSTTGLESTLAKIGQMLIMDADLPPEDPARVLVDVQEYDGRGLLEAYVKRHAKFCTVPFDPTGDLLRLYPGGVTIWSGFPGAGKTTLLRQLICHCLARGSSVFLASLEEDPENVLVNLAAVAAGAPLPNVHQMQWFIDAYGERFRLWGKIGIAESEELLSVIRGLALFGIKHAIIDSLMCLDVPNDDFEAQRRFANRIAATARAGRIHIHLVAHPRKLVSADQELDINDVAGARELSGIADNVVFVRRGSDEQRDMKADMTPVVIGVKKQRHGTGAIGNIMGWYHRHMRQFQIEQFPRQPTRYLPDDAYVEMA